MIGVLIAILLALLIFRGKAKTLLLVLLIAAVAALGIEWFDYDIDLGRLWDT